MRNDADLFRIYGIKPDYEEELFLSGSPSRDELLRKATRIVGEEIVEDMSHEELLNLINGG